MPTFVTPWMLAGGLLIAVPIMLHLVMREKPKHLIFPALRFIKQRREANRRRLRLRHLLLLALRCAIILLFAAALARPVFQSAGFLAAEAPVAAALVFDTRPRMAYREKNDSRLDAARKLGREVLEQLPRDSELVVLDSGSGRSRFDVDRGAAMQRIGQLALTYATTDLVSMLDGALSVLRKSEQPRREIYLFTDMAASDWSSPDVVARWKQRLEENPDTVVFLVDVGTKDPRDFALGDLQLSSQVLTEDGLLSTATDVLASGQGGQRTVQLMITDGQRDPEKRAEQTVDCRAGDAVEVELKTTLGQPGTYQGTMQFARSDNLAVDDVRYFSVRVARPWQVLVVAPEPTDFFSRLLARALAPSALRRRGDARYELDVAATAELESRNIDDYDAVWLLDPAPLSVAVWNKLTGYVMAGGGLAIALGGRAGLTPDAFNATASFDLLPGPLDRQWKSYDLYLAPDRLEHPVLQPLKTREGAIPWDLNPVFKIWELGPLESGVQEVISYSDRRPALLARNTGLGRVLTLTTSLAASGRSPWNELLAPREEAWPGFVLVNSMTDYLVGRVGQRLNYEIGEVAEIAIDAGNRRFDSYLLSTPQGTRRVTVTEQDRNVMIAGTDWPGQYRLEAGGTQGVRYGFSVNVPASATRVGRADLAALREQLGELPLPIVDSADALRALRRVAASRSQWEAFPWLVLLLAIVVVGETLLSTLFYRKRN